MLLCGMADGCKPVKHQFEYKETDIKLSIGAGKDEKACLVV